MAIQEHYESILPKLREAARNCGYALAVHGSMRKDLDLVAVPWISDATSEYELSIMLARSVGGSVATPDIIKPNRMALLIKLPEFDGENYCIDLAITPIV